MKLKTHLSFLALLALSAASCNGQGNSEPSLKEALKGKFYIGTALNLNQIRGTDTASNEIVVSQFDAIVAENCMKSMYLQPREGEFFFDDADKFVEFGEQNGMFVTGHCLIWHSQLPSWFLVDAEGNDVSAEVLKERMKSHITTVVSRYKGRIKGWDVVNEAIMEDGSYRNSKFYQILGEEFIPLAFQYAHEADPEAELYYNDYNEWYPGKRDAIVAMVKSFQQRGIRIDAVGMQGHVGMDSPDLNEYRAAIDAYTSAGVKIAVTELDISALPSRRPDIGANIADTEAYRQEMNPYTEGLPEAVSKAWNERMGDFFRLFLEYPGKVSRVTMWGVTDGDSWKNGFPMRNRTDYPLLFDRQYQPKPVVRQIVTMTKR
jgi:endo-1,4-beta-xylanase